MAKNQFKLVNRGILAGAMLSVAALLSSCSKEDMKGPQTPDTSFTESQAKDGQYIPNQYLVTLKSDAQSPAEQAYQISDRASRIFTENHINFNTIAKDDIFDGIVKGFIAHISDAEAAQLKNDPRVANIEQDQVVSCGTVVTGVLTTANGTQTTPWGISKIGGAGDGTGKTAWIIDSGIDPNHTDLNVDKTRSASFLISGQAGTITSPWDEFGHGTRVAGILGAKNNDYGTVGVAANATLVSVRVLDKNGAGTLGGLYKGINYVYNNGKAGDVANISILGGASLTIDNAVKSLAAKGVFVAIAAGNSAVNCSNNSPQRVNATNVYTVSAMDQNGAFWSSSDYGQPVDFTAPGVNVYSTMLGGGYGYGTGTSFASPYLAGILLLTDGHPSKYGYVTGDKDSYTDPIAHR